MYQVPGWHHVLFVSGAHRFQTGILVVATMVAEAVGSRISVHRVRALGRRQLPMLHIEGSRETGSEPHTGYLWRLPNLEHQHISLICPAVIMSKDAANKHLNRVQVVL